MSFWTRFKSRQNSAERSDPPAQPQRPDSVADLVNALTNTVATLMTSSAQMVATFQAAELERLKETKDERVEEKKYRREQREAEREAKRNAAIETNMKKALAKSGGVVAGDALAQEIQMCRVCAGAISLTPYEVDIHHAHQHEMYIVRTSGSRAANNNAGN